MLRSSDVPRAKRAVISTLLGITGLFLVPVFVLLVWDPIPSRNKAKLTQALSNCRQFSLAAGEYLKKNKTLPTISDLIASGSLSLSDASKLLDPPGIYVLQYPPPASGNPLPTVEYFSPLGTAHYAPDGRSEIIESKKLTPQPHQ